MNSSEIELLKTQEVLKSLWHTWPINHSFELNDIEVPISC